jgi:hypothetical protein
MYILLYSVVISALIFGVYQYFDSINRDADSPPYDITKDILTVNNIMIYILILSIVFFVMYMAFDNENDVFSSLGIYENSSSEIKKTNVNPYILKNTTDPMKMGFEPHNSGGSKSNSETDASSVTSSECSVDSE